MTAVSQCHAPDGTAYDALIFDWDGTLVDFPVKFFCSGAVLKLVVLGLRRPAAADWRPSPCRSPDWR
jgi:hypothetical protein